MGDGNIFKYYIHMCRHGKTVKLGQVGFAGQTGQSGRRLIRVELTRIFQTIFFFF